VTTTTIHDEAAAAAAVVVVVCYVYSDDQDSSLLSLSSSSCEYDHYPSVAYYWLLLTLLPSHRFISIIIYILYRRFKKLFVNREDNNSENRKIKITLEEIVMSCYTSVCMRIQICARLNILTQHMPVFLRSI
jgi:hypothetical protein